MKLVYERLSNFALMNPLVKAHLILLTTALIGGFHYSVSKSVMPDYIHPSAIIVFRGIAAIIFFWLIHALFIKEKIRDAKDYFKLWSCALFGITTNQLLFFNGLNLTSPINAAVLQCGVPIFVVILSAVMIKEKMSSLKIFGLITGATGAVLLLINTNKAQITGTHIGDIMIILNAASYAVFLIMVKPLTEKYDPFTVVKWVFLFGTIMAAPFGYRQFIEITWSSLPFNAWMSIGFIIIFATFVNYYLNIGVLRYVNPSVAGIYVYLVPVFATIIAIVMKQDSLTVEKFVYSLLIFGGVYLVSKKF
jgi:drug/metabolite transporter (DMT)-like permease